jgi:hypothetical protein
MRRTIAFKIPTKLKLIEELDQILHVFADRMHSETRNPEPDSLKLYPNVQVVGGSATLLIRICMYLHQFTSGHKIRCCMRLGANRVPIQNSESNFTNQAW